MRHGSNLDPPNRFESIQRQPDFADEWEDSEASPKSDQRRIEYIADESKSIVTENDSPDIPFRYSINPYRGCIHACAYCYARPGHEYLGFNAGLDFETKIVVKHRAPQLLREFLARPAWRPEPIIFSGVTDCYQPAERQFQLTRQCLEIALQHQQPVGVITKNALVLRDLSILERLARQQLAHVFVSITSLNPELARVMEPRTSIPSARLRAVRELADAGVPVGVMVAPLIPGLNDSEMPQILKAAKEAGAWTANYIMLRLPLTVEPVFREWLQRTHPDRADLVLGRIRSVRDGKLNDSTWGQRQLGSGLIADQIRSMFALFRKQYQLDRELPTLDVDRFRLPAELSGQMRLF